MKAELLKGRSKRNTQTRQRKARDEKDDGGESKAKAIEKVAPEAKKDNPEETKVELMMRSGTGVKAVAKVVGVSVAELKKRYPDAITMAAINAKAAVMQVIYEKATKDKNLPAAMFWAKVYVVPKLAKNGASKPSGVPKIDIKTEAPKTA